jgi:multiple sugar transport system substrate-binding protein
MKKLFAVFFILFSIILSGCTRNISSNATTIKFSSWGSQSEVTILKKLIEDFEKKNPDIKVEFMHIPQNYFQKLHLLFASNLAPDVVFLNNIYAPIYINANLLEDLKPYFQEEIRNNVFYENTIKSFSYEDKIYAIPRDVSNLVIYYNKDLFYKYKIKYPEKNWTISDFLRISQEIKKKGTFAINSETDSLYWLYFVSTNGGGILSDNKKSIIITDKNSIEALQLYSDLFNKYKIAPTKSQISSKTGAQMFVNGEIAMYLSGRWMVPKLREIAHFNWDIINFPSSTKGKTLVDSSAWSVSKNSKNKDASIKLIKFLSSKNSIEKLSASGLIIPARIDVANSDCFLSKEKKPLNSYLFLETIKNSKPTPVNKNYAQINDILNETLEPLFNGNKAAKEVLNENLEKKLNDLL